MIFKMPQTNVANEKEIIAKLHRRNGSLNINKNPAQQYHEHAFKRMACLKQSKQLYELEALI